MGIEKEMQKHYDELAETMDEYGKGDRSFILWYLLQDYIEDTQKELDALPVEKDKRQFAIAVICERQIKAAEEMREILMYDIF